jgi:hypothetical protein
MTSPLESTLTATCSPTSETSIAPSGITCAGPAQAGVHLTDAGHKTETTLPTTSVVNHDTSVVNHDTSVVNHDTSVVNHEKILMLDKVMAYVKYHRDEAIPEIQKPINSNKLADLVIDRWDVQFMDELVETNMQLLYDVIKEADRRNISSLVDLGIVKLATIVKGQSLEKIKILLDPKRREHKRNVDIEKRQQENKHSGDHATNKASNKNGGDWAQPSESDLAQEGNAAFMSGNQSGLISASSFARDGQHK